MQFCFPAAFGEGPSPFSPTSVHTVSIPFSIPTYFFLQGEGKKGNTQAEVNSVECNINLELIILGMSFDITEAEC